MIGGLFGDTKISVVFLVYVLLVLLIYYCSVDFPEMLRWAECEVLLYLTFLLSVVVFM